MRATLLFQLVFAALLAVSCAPTPARISPGSTVHADAVPGTLVRGALALRGCPCSDLAAVTAADGHVELFARSLADGSLWRAWEAAGAYSTASSQLLSAPGYTVPFPPYRRIPGEKTERAPAAVLSHADGQIHLFYVSLVNGLVEQTGAVAATWSRLVTVRGTGLHDPYAIERADQRLALFAVNGAGSLVESHQLAPGGSSGWSAWVTVGTPAAGVTVSGRPSAVVDPNSGLLSVFVRGSDGGTSFRSYLAAGLSPWRSLGGDMSFTVQPVYDANGALVVYGRGSDGGIWANGYGLDGRFGGWSRLQAGDVSRPLGVSGPPVVDSEPDGRQILLYGNADRFFGLAQCGAGSWNLHALTTAGPGAATSAASAVASAHEADQRLVAFHLDAAGALSYARSATAAQPFAGCGALPRVTTCPGTPATFCTRDGAPVPLAGMNYVELVRALWQFPGHNDDIVSQAAFLVNYYSPAVVQANLDQIAAGGYRYVRVFLNHEGPGQPLDANGNPIAGATPLWGLAGPWVTSDATHFQGLYRPYMENFVDFLRRARANGIYVQPTLGWGPQNDTYQNPQVPEDANHHWYVDPVNLQFLTQSYIDVRKRLVQSLLQYVKNADPDLLSTIVAIDLWNEISVSTQAAPFSRTDVVPLANGKSYDMTRDSDRQAAFDEGIVYWANQLVDGAHSVDPDTLVGASVFTFHVMGLTGPNGVHSTASQLANGDSRYPARPAAFAAPDCRLSYLDIHVYPSATPGYAAATDLATEELATVDLTRKPLWLGEFGAYTFVFPTAAAAAPGLVAHKTQLVNAGFRAWGMWTWAGDQGPLLWTATQDLRVIDQALAPFDHGF
jgi:hypothetical protein